MYVKCIFRKLLIIDIKHIPPIKKFCFMNDCQPTCVSREDFVSDEVWERFLKLMIYKNRRVDSSQRNQGEKRIGNIKELIKDWF